MKIINTKGFTLIELLVVISIIGILASIVLIQFPGAVSRARDSRVMSSLGQFRTQARIVYANSENYEDVECVIDTDSRVCTNCNTGIKALCDDVGQNATDIFEIYVDDDGKGYCASVQLDGSGKYFCIDGSGEEEGALHAKEYDTEPERCNSGYDCVSGDDCRCE